MSEAEDVVSFYEERGHFDPSLRRDIAADVPYIGNFLMTDVEQQVTQAERNWIQAGLRWSSGATIKGEEIGLEGDMFFPRAGDSPAVIAQKSQARRTMIDAVRRASATTLHDEGVYDAEATKLFHKQKMLHLRRTAGTPKRFTELVSR
jgi:hypothetical protein